MNVLSIGNSFSQDAQRYIHKIAKTDGCEVNTFNLYIGGCPLDLHYRNMLSDEKAYLLEMNGESTGFYVSLKEALLNRKWDVVTIQQVSQLSVCYDTFQPYLNEIVDCIRKYQPEAKIGIQETWAYEQDSYRLTVELGYTCWEDMLRDVKCAYEKAMVESGADFLIPSGELFGKLLLCGIERIHRDTFHASLGLGRYALSLLWYKVLTGNDITDNIFSEFDEEISREHILTIKKCVNEIAD